MKIGQAVCCFVDGTIIEIKRKDWPEHAWLRFRWIKEARGEFATMLGDGAGNEYLFSRADLSADNWEVRVVNQVAETWRDFGGGREHESDRGDQEWAAVSTEGQGRLVPSL